MAVAQIQHVPSGHQLTHPHQQQQQQVNPQQPRKTELPQKVSSPVLDRKTGNFSKGKVYSASRMVVGLLRASGVQGLIQKTNFEIEVCKTSVGLNYD